MTSVFSPVPDTERFAIPAVRGALALSDDIPVVRMDARSSGTGLKTLVTLVEHALQRATAGVR